MYVSDFLTVLKSDSMLQGKYTSKLDDLLVGEEVQELEELLIYYVDHLKISLEDIVSCYSFINKMVLEETYFFMRNGRYRYSTFEEVESKVYANKDYMKKYMVGLTFSDYLWVQHLQLVRFFKECLSNLSGSYFEIGPGFGQFLSKAIKSNRFSSFEAIDISLTSVKNSNRYLSYLSLADHCHVKQEDFMEYSSGERYDCIVMGEVLEHVEHPKEMLVKICELLSENGKAFITTVINGPALDHIYLFKSVEEILEMAEQAGFEILQYRCYAEGEMSLEKAKKKKACIDIAMLLQKKVI